MRVERDTLIAEYLKPESIDTTVTGYANLEAPPVVAIDFGALLNSLSEQDELELESLRKWCDAYLARHPEPGPHSDALRDIRARFNPENREP